MKQFFFFFNSVSFANYSCFRWEFEFIHVFKPWVTFAVTFDGYYRLYYWKLSWSLIRIFCVSRGLYWFLSLKFTEVHYKGSKVSLWKFSEGAFPLPYTHWNIKLIMTTIFIEIKIKLFFLGDILYYFYKIQNSTLRYNSITNRKYL